MPMPVDSVTVREVDGTEYREVFATARVPQRGRVSIADALGVLLGDTESWPLRVQVFAAAGIEVIPADQMCSQVVVHEQYPFAEHGAVIEVQAVTGVRPEPVPGHANAALVRTPTGTRLSCAITRPAGDTLAEQATAAFADIEVVLASAGMTPMQVTRTWYFIDDIERTYGEFNVVRNAFFDRWGVTDFPASTGIGGRPAGSRLAVIVEAHSGVDVVRRVDSTMQCPPVRYGPRFARANTLLYNGNRLVNVSGISSIDASGNSLDYTVEDAVDYTMRSFADLLAAGGVDHGDIVSAYAYCKNSVVRKEFERYLDTHALNFPYLLNHADICRPELPFEIEAKAIHPVVPE
jgi:enamine deaminase RidA (YjgF/YER057c/UK114 family)